MDTPALGDTRLEHLDHTVVRHGRVSSLEEAAALRGVEPSAIIKTIVVRRGEDDYVLVLVPGDRVIDWPLLRDVLGERRLSMPEVDEAYEATGYVRGTITPFGAKRPFPIVADEGAASGTVSIGGGAHGVSLTVSGEELVSALDATVAPVTKARSD